ncbi:MAG: beta-galactosidase [Patescibacteria group bacterium]
MRQDGKRKRILYITFGIFLLIVLLFSHGPDYSEEKIEVGVTFSHKKAEELGLDWKEVYKKTLNELEVKKIRIPAYWDETEPEKGKYDWQKLDWQLEQAEQNGVEVILAVGKRLPRWPECHFPGWTQEAKREQWEEDLLEYIEKTVNRYKDNKNIIAWQVENEPFLSEYFGECPKLDTDFLDKEISLVRKTDSRPIVITDSGELSLWAPAAGRADIFGTTMYKRTYSQALNSYVTYPIGPGFFHFKKNVADMFAEPDKWIVIELQAEPWGAKSYQNLTEEERDKTMSLQKFREMIKFARRSGFNELYLWGVEYWYWEKVKNNNPEYWEEAKKIYNKK